MNTVESPHTLLIIDDEENMRHMLQAMVGRHGYAVETAADGAQALQLLAGRRFDFILCDVRMPEMDGIAFLAAARDHLERTTVIMMSAYGSIDTAIEAMKAGAYDFISKPFKADEVIMALRKAEEREALRQENLQLRREIEAMRGQAGFARIITNSPEMQAVLKLAAKAARYDSTVLITGESGTGKELMARGIHDASPRREQPFIALNCGGIPANLLESELFGYLKGAFTGADRSRRGLFEEAEGGTLLLDEIGELPLSLQVKLLRVLQEREIRPSGGERLPQDRCPDPRGDGPRPGGRGAARAVPGGSLLPPQRHPDRDPAAAPAAVRHPAAVPPFPGKGAEGNGDRDHQGHARGHGAVRSLRLAGQCPRTGEHHPPGGGDRRRPGDPGRPSAAVYEGQAVGGQMPGRF